MISKVLPRLDRRDAVKQAEAVELLELFWKIAPAFPIENTRDVLIRNALRGYAYGFFRKGVSMFGI